MTKFKPHRCEAVLAESEMPESCRGEYYYRQRCVRQAVGYVIDGYGAEFRLCQQHLFKAKYATDLLYVEAMRWGTQDKLV